MKFVTISISFCLIMVIWSASNIHWGGERYQGLIKADGKGYYAHLPALFIYHDLNFSHFEPIEAGKYYNKNYYYDYRKEFNGKTFNKYFAGTSLAMLPFFVGGHLLTLITGGETDGYSRYYALSISLGAMFYMMGTLFLMVLIFKNMGFNSRLIALAIPFIVFGTNWYYYVVSEPAMSHVYSIFFITLFFYLIQKWSYSPNYKWLLFASLTMGMIIFIRPVNGMALFCIPIVFNSKSEFVNFVQKVFRKPQILILIILAGLLIPAIQLLIYKIQTGSFLVYSYEEEGFNFLKPHFLDILFSYKKGLFLYTPLLLVSLIGIFSMMRVNMWKALTLTGLLMIVTYVLSSWWNWYYGGSFSSRAFIEYYLFFMIPMLYLFRWASRQVLWKKVVISTIFLAGIAFCQFQTFQYRHMVIHWDGMTKESYWDSFLNTDFLKK